MEWDFFSEPNIEGVYVPPPIDNEEINNHLLKNKDDLINRKIRKF